MRSRDTTSCDCVSWISELFASDELSVYWRNIKRQHTCVLMSAEGQNKGCVQRLVLLAVILCSGLPSWSPVMVNKSTWLRLPTVKFHAAKASKIAFCVESPSCAFAVNNYINQAINWSFSIHLIFKHLPCCHLILTASVKAATIIFWTGEYTVCGHLIENLTLIIFTEYPVLGEVYQS